MRTFSYRCRSFFDVAPLFFGNPKGDCSFFFGSHHDLPSAWISAVGGTSLMPAGANNCLRVQARPRKFLRCQCLHLQAKSLRACAPEGVTCQINQVQSTSSRFQNLRTESRICINFASFFESFFGPLGIVLLTYLSTCGGVSCTLANLIRVARRAALELGGGLGLRVDFASHECKTAAAVGIFRVLK